MPILPIFQLRDQPWIRLSLPWSQSLIFGPEQWKVSKSSVIYLGSKLRCLIWIDWISARSFLIDSGTLGLDRVPRFNFDPVDQHWSVRNLMNQIACVRGIMLILKSRRSWFRWANHTKPHKLAHLVSVQLCNSILEKLKCSTYAIDVSHVCNSCFACLQFVLC